MSDKEVIEISDDSVEILFANSRRPSSSLRKRKIANTAVVNRKRLKTSPSASPVYLRQNQQQYIELSSESENELANRPSSVQKLMLNAHSGLSDTKEIVRVTGKTKDVESKASRYKIALESYYDREIWANVLDDRGLHYSQFQEHTHDPPPVQKQPRIDFPRPKIAHHDLEGHVYDSHGRIQVALGRKIAYHVPRSLRLAWVALWTLKKGREVESAHPGAINAILSLSDSYIIASCVKGEPDMDHELEIQMNEAGALKQYAKKSNYVLPAHVHYTSANGVPRHFSINDIQVDPKQNNTFVSAGNDGQIQVWRKSNDSDEFQMVNSFTVDDDDDSIIPINDIKFNPSGSFLAITCCGCDQRRCRVYIYPTSSLLSNDPVPHHVHKVACGSVFRQRTGAILWGHGFSNSQLFVSSESIQELDREPGREDVIFDSHTGIHRAIRVDQMTAKTKGTFDAPESGDAMALDPTGMYLALFTADATTNYLRIFDVSTRQTSFSKEPVQSIQLLPFSPRCGDINEVNCAEFSPDGVFLSVARSDNEIHIYDSRFLHNGVIRRFQHDDGPGTRAVGEPSFGAVQSVWLTGNRCRRLGLLTGGDDGAVRLWDMGIPENERLYNGRVIAQGTSGVGRFLYFELASQGYDNVALIVGDNNGRVNIYQYKSAE